MQSAVFVGGMIYLMALIGLNLIGLFEFTLPFAFSGSARDSLAGSFSTGVLASLVATPCTAPFMATAVGAALTLPSALGMVIFLSLGLGLAFPYLLLTAFPALRGFLPKPGAWMERFKQFLAFPMFATTVWLVWVLAQQGTVDQLALVLLGLVGLAMGLWLWRYAGRRPLMRLCAAVLLLVSFLPLDGLRQAGALTQASELSVVPEVFSPSRLESLRAEGKPVFVNATAAWCITCKVNERVALKTTAVQQAFAARGLTYLYADWTNENPDITAFLASFGRSGVPLYAYYPAGTAEPSLLPQLLTPDLVLDALDAADEARDQSGRLQ